MRPRASNHRGPFLRIPCSDCAFQLLSKSRSPVERATPAPQVRLVMRVTVAVTGRSSASNAHDATCPCPPTHRKEWPDRGRVLWYQMPVVGSTDALPGVPAWRQL